jgi:hypothetical protein
VTIFIVPGLAHSLLAAPPRHCERSAAIQPKRMPVAGLDCFAAAAKRQFILSDAAGGVEGLLAMTEEGSAAAP